MELLKTTSEKVIAQHLTHIEFSIYKLIQPYELLNGAWMKAKLKHRATHVLSLISRFNSVTLWVASVILWQEKLKDRQKILLKFIKICGVRCFEEYSHFESHLKIILGIG